MKTIRIQNLRDFLIQTTGCCTYWYPLKNLIMSIPVAAYDIRKIYNDFCTEQMLHILNDFNVKSVYAVQLDHNHVLQLNNLDALFLEKDEFGFVFPWCTETYYYDDPQTWMIYVSHEGTITFAGEELVASANKILPERYLYNITT